MWGTCCVPWVSAGQLQLQAGQEFSDVPTAVHREAPQVLFPSTEAFSAGNDFYFSVSCVPAQPHSPLGFLLVFKKEKCSTAGTSQVKARCGESNLSFGLLN